MYRILSASADTYITNKIIRNSFILLGYDRSRKINNKKISYNKKNLICNTCSRGKFTKHWTTTMQSKLLSRQDTAITKIESMV